MVVIRQSWVGCLVFVMAMGLAWADGPSAFVAKANRDYTVLDSPSVKGSQDPKEPKVTLIEFFNYACPACAHFEPRLEVWLKKKPKPFSFKRIPVVFHSDWDYFAKVYLVAEQLAIQDKITPSIFSELSQVVDVSTHGLIDPQTMDKLFTRSGGKPGQLLDALNHSPTLTSLLRQSVQIASDWRVSVVPTFVVCEKYKTDFTQISGPEEARVERLFQVLDALVLQCEKDNKQQKAKV